MMTTHTLIILHPDTLKPDISDHFMRTGALTALKKLSEHGFLPAVDLHDSGPEITRLLTQEQITFRNLADDDTLTDDDTEVNTVTVTVHSSGKLAVSPGTAGSADPMLFSSWDEAARHLLTGFRSARHTRKTGETDITVAIRLDGSGASKIDTGIPFYDHMLEQIARHGYMDLDITCRGDLDIDEHHTIEDTAITLGEAIGLALGDKRGIGRYGFVVAMDETRSLAAIDLSGRPWCVFEGTFHREKVGEFPTEMTSHFFHSLAMALRATLHVSVKGENDHHQIEACFKALARCLRQAIDRNEKYRDILPTSKGLL